MNKSVLRTMIVIIICMLAFEYILKFFVPKEFVLVISNPNLIKAGDYINSHKWAYYLISSLFSFITYYLFTCACSRKKFLNKVECLIIGIIIIVGHLINLIDYQLSTPYLVSTMIFISAYSHSNMKDFAIVFIVHTIAQNLSLKIRGLSTFMVSFDMLTCTVLGIESYLWLVLFYVLNCYNIKERKVN